MRMIYLVTTNEIIYYRMVGSSISVMSMLTGQCPMSWGRIQCCGVNCRWIINISRWRSVCTSGECISGALYWKDLVKIATQVGFSPPIIVSAKTISTCGQGAQSLLGKGSGCKWVFICLHLVVDSVKSDPSISSNPELLKLLSQYILIISHRVN